MANTKQPPTPYCQALMVCNEFSLDHLKRASVIGIFDSVSAPVYPARQARMIFFSQLADSLGKKKVTLRLVGWVSKKTIWEETVDVEFDNQRQTLGVVYEAKDIVFPAPGDYRVEIEVDGQVLMDRRITATQPKP
jgi:hypothetical protein